ncbi:hypothetical protein AVDCRST_MAG82-1395, partial [uncultured Rubrobacteraceae bacterium]
GAHDDRRGPLGVRAGPRARSGRGNGGHPGPHAAGGEGPDRERRAFRCGRARPIPSRRRRYGPHPRHQATPPTDARRRPERRGQRRRGGLEGRGRRRHPQRDAPSRNRLFAQTARRI